jgi:hypothetical protein
VLNSRIRWSSRSVQKLWRNYWCDLAHQRELSIENTVLHRSKLWHPGTVSSGSLGPVTNDPRRPSVCFNPDPCNGRRSALAAGNHQVAAVSNLLNRLLGTGSVSSARAARRPIPSTRRATSRSNRDLAASRPTSGTTRTCGRPSCFPTALGRQ